MRPAISSASLALNQHLDSRPAIELRQVPLACARANGIESAYDLIAPIRAWTQGVDRSDTISVQPRQLGILLSLPRKERP
jgi:hypothetical protein